MTESIKKLPMKFEKLLCSFFVLACLCSCVMSKDVFDLAGDKSLGTVKGKGDFVELTNGKIIEGTVSNNNLYNHKFFVNRTGTLEISGKKYNYDEILALQDKGEYYRKGSKDYLLPRIKAGKINLYRRYMQNSGTDSRGKYYSNDFYLHFLQKGDANEMVSFSIKTLEEMVADNQSALNFISQYKEHKKQKNHDSYLDKAIDAYNSK